MDGMLKFRDFWPLTAGSVRLTPGVRQFGIRKRIRGSRTSGMTKKTFFKKDFLFC